MVFDVARYFGIHNRLIILYIINDSAHKKFCYIFLLVQVNIGFLRYKLFAGSISHQNFVATSFLLPLDICAWQLVSEDKERSAALVACVQGNANDKGFRLKVKGLNEDSMYSVEQLNITASGKTLMNVGLPFVKSLKEHESVLLDIVRQP